VIAHDFPDSTTTGTTKPMMTHTMPTTAGTADTHHDDHELLVAERVGAQRGPLA
jgi:hypothetical protein